MRWKICINKITLISDILDSNKDKPNNQLYKNNWLYILEAPYTQITSKAIAEY